jgi:hypothetical protein
MVVRGLCIHYTFIKKITFWSTTKNVYRYQALVNINMETKAVSKLCYLVKNSDDIHLHYYYILGSNLQGSGFWSNFFRNGSNSYLVKNWFYTLYFY